MHDNIFPFPIRSLFSRQKHLHLVSYTHSWFNEHFEKIFKKLVLRKVGQVKLLHYPKMSKIVYLIFN